LREGECEGTDAQEEQSVPKPRSHQEQSIEPRKTRGVRRDYSQLNDPYTSEEDEGPDQEEDNLIQEVLTAEIGDKFHSLKEARNSSDWPEWEKAIASELQQH